MFALAANKTSQDDRQLWSSECYDFFRRLVQKSKNKNALKDLCCNAAHNGVTIVERHGHATGEPFVSITMKIRRFTVNNPIIEQITGLRRQIKSTSGFRGLHGEASA